MDEALSSRFGSPSEFSDNFSELGTGVKLKFELLLSTAKAKNHEQHEIVRQQLLKILGRPQNVWRLTNTDYDEDIKICRIYASPDSCEFIAFMRVGPRGYRTDQVLPKGAEIIFHVIQGSIQFFYKYNCKALTRGNTIKVLDDSPYSLKCLTYDQCSYLIFRVFDSSKKVIYVDDTSDD